MKEKLTHEKNGKHDFPATNANAEAAIKAGQPGGTFASGSRPNLKSKSLFVTIVEAPADTLGLHKAICFEKFNRKELTEEDKYHKPDLLRARMTHYYEIGQDGGLPKLTAKRFMIIWPRRSIQWTEDSCFATQSAWILAPWSIMQLMQVESM